MQSTQFWWSCAEIGDCEHSRLPVFHWAMHGLISLLIVKVSTIGKWPFYLYFKSKLHSTFYWRELKHFCVHTILVICGLKQAWSNCALCIPFILSGSPKECWLHTCDACIISWRLGLRAPLVTHKNIMEKIYWQTFLKVIMAKCNWAWCGCFFQIIPERNQGRNM